MIIGGAGQDVLFGGRGDDLLIGASTDHDQDLTTLDRIYTEWNSGSSIATRVSNLSVGLLASSSIHDDDVRDWLKGGRGSDWYIGDFFGCDRDLFFGFGSVDEATHVP